MGAGGEVSREAELQKSCGKVLSLSVTNLEPFWLLKFTANPAQSTHLWLSVRRKHTECGWVFPPAPPPDS